MKRFEEQIKNAAKELRDRNQKKFKTGKNLLESRQLSWGWITTPVAAVSGIIIGLLMQGAPNMTLYTGAKIHDTVSYKQIVYDTVYLYSQDNTDTANNHLSSPSEPHSAKGKCILEDGIDYSLLMTML